MKHFWHGACSFLACEGFGENVRPFIPRLHFFFFFFKVEINSRTLIPFFRPGSVHSGSASWDDWEHSKDGNSGLYLQSSVFWKEEEEKKKKEKREEKQKDM